ncbi:MAG: tetratricopeptide repeat protein [Opitutaceae bacterium]
MSCLIKKSIVVCCLIALASAVAHGVGPKDESLAGQIQRAKALIHSQQLVEVRPLLQSLLVNPEVEPSVHPTLEFHIALSYVFEYFESDNKGALGEAIQQFTAFVKKYPKHLLTPTAQYNLADLHAAAKDFKAALQGYIPLYNNPVAGIKRAEVLKKIILIYIVENEWVAGTAYFEAGMRTAESSEDRTTYAAYLLIAKAKAGDVSNSRQYLEFFNSSAPVFFTPRFNASLMEVGDQLRNEGDLATASLFYRFVRPYEELEVGLGHYIKRLKRKVARYEGNVVLRNFYQQAKTELDNAEADLAALKASTNYTPLLNWRLAGVYMDMGRDWEAFWRFRVMVDTYPKHEYAEDILFSAFSLARKLGEGVEAKALAERYLGQDSFVRYRGTVADELTTDYLELKEYEDLFKLTRWYLKLEVDDGAASLLLFKYGMARLQRFETQELVSDFQVFKAKYAGASFSLVIDYFLGLGHLTEENHQDALELFEEVIAHPNTRFRADASFRKALCVMGLDRLDEARNLTLEFVATYPDNPLRAQAELVLGNLTNILGDADAALVHYYLIEQHTDDLGLLATGETKIAQIVFDRGDDDDAIARLVTFIESHPEAPEIIPVVVTVAGFHNQLEQPRVALNRIKGPLDQFFEMTEVDELDGLLVEYLKQDRVLRAMRAQTELFFEELNQSPDLLKAIVGDRGKQYRYFKENPQIDALVKYHFVKDDAFRAVIIDHYKVLDEAYAKKVAELAVTNPEAPAPEQEPYPVVEHTVLDDLRAEIQVLNEAIPEQSADDWLAGRLAQASETPNLPLVVRIEAALAATETPAGRPRPELLDLIKDEVVWSRIGPSGRLWILEAFAENHPAETIELLEFAKIDYMNTSAELDMHRLMAACYQKVGRVRDAIDRHKILIKRFAAAEEACEAALTIGRLEIEAGNFAVARQQLELILHRNEWRGQRHGDALLWIGRAYVAEGKFSEAHGFFERIMLGYPGFNELLGTAYYEDILVLKKMGEPASAQTVYEAFTMTPGLENTEAAARIRKEFE